MLQAAVTDAPEATKEEQEAPTEKTDQEVVELEKWYYAHYELDGVEKEKFRTTSLDSAYKEAQKAVNVLKDPAKKGIKMHRLGERGIGRYWEGREDTEKGPETGSLHKIWLSMEELPVGSVKQELRKVNNNGSGSGKAA